MKKQTAILIMALSAFTFTATMAQTGAAPAVTPTSQEPKVLNDAAMSSRLSTDLNTRNSQLGDNRVSWFDTGSGYYGTYSIGDTNYMTRYDQKGNYQQTYTQSDWTNGNVPATLRSSFDQSEYKGQNVTGYWTTSDPGQKGYYLEVEGNDGKISRIYSDEKGKFSNVPSRKSSSKNPKQ